jgi:hypothetical protein
MTFNVEIVLRGDNRAVTEQVQHATEASAWDQDDVESILKAILLAIERARDPRSDPHYVALRGFSWIVEPSEGGVVIAIEIPTGAAVAGPFDIAQPRLDRLISSVIAPRPHGPHPTIH